MIKKPPRDRRFFVILFIDKEREVHIIDKCEKSCIKESKKLQKTLTKKQYDGIMILLYFCMAYKDFGLVTVPYNTYKRRTRNEKNIGTHFSSDDGIFLHRTYIL